MADREKGGFWVGAAAALFYPLAYLSKREYRNFEGIPRTGPVLLVMNHVSHLDPAVDAVFVHQAKRVPRFLAKASLARVPVFGKIMTGAGSIPVARGTSSAGDSLKAAHQALDEGKVIVIYPEGTITKDPEFWPKRTQTGVARLALANDVPVIPCARWGTQEVLNGYSKKFRPLPRKTVTHVVGEPVDLSAYREKAPTPDVLREVTDLLMAEVTTLLADIRGEEPPAKAGRDA
ncbi:MULTISPECIES: lysophospholipid acyltransferase family protein [Prauserella salsuginis group]|uniref:1-acyl-sn-glycerol-3-phosphate acyltransferase n=2 Tax=Prauserella salsuginis group TaxID=2893672 RepID=A0A839XNG9_9PSEU|nr:MULTISPECIES: lysophospholipid acyltransferase family protein [Prauserella salsuginis group]MBB3661475.1 1-acyl-sn-glycerol-3-phosphate acyltransferase [Prauserella sediminis]MCR3719396.1 1-acyl-sn-glycerol-3-phosphate acyltransferases [Prauserella flava]MCR3735590.1 1-acyl-sn-glycerol-3-phosphate acyltransferases [Prauserella salsuginis]